jgi:hypothetical protein
MDEMRAILMRQGRKVPIYESSVLKAVNANLKTFGSIDAELFLVNHVHLLTNSVIFSRKVKGAAALRQASQPQISVHVNDSSKEESISETVPSLASSAAHGTHRFAGGIAQGTAKIVRDTGTMVRKTNSNSATMYILRLL